MRPMTAAVALVILALGSTPASPQAGSPAPGQYDVVTDWATLPEGRVWGSASAIALDGDRNIWIAERCGSNTCEGASVAPVLKFNPSGTLLASFGADMLVWPHGLHVDHDGNVWVTDGRGADGKGHQVLKFSPSGTLLLALGTAGVPGDGPDTFNQPSDVAVAPNGDIFVADGHGGDSNARIVKFSKDGTFTKTWGKKGSRPGEFDDPHAVEFDSRGRLFVADRQNNRIQLFDQDGRFLEEWRQFGRPSGISIDEHDAIYVSEADSGVTRMGRAKGVWIGNARDGSTTLFISDPGGNPEGIAADGQGTVYGTEVSSRRVKKYVKR
jgi:streptogramin lyase